MSFICGIICDNGEYGRSSLKKMNERADRIYQDKGYAISIETKVEDNVAVSSFNWPYYKALNNIHCKNDMLVMIDGRIDNRQDLITKYHIEQDNISNTELILQVFQATNINRLAADLIGDYSFCIVNLKNSNVYCARSPFGNRPLYYLIKNNIFAWASNLSQLTDLNISKSIKDSDEFLYRYAAEYLCSTLHGRMETTPYESIYNLLPGHYLSYVAGKIKIKEFYMPAKYDLAMHCKSEREYDRLFEEYLSNAVRCRINGLDKVKTAVHLSGGLDSSSIACILKKIEREENKKFNIILLHDLYNGIGNEIDYAKLVSEHTEYPLEIRSSSDQVWLLKDIEPLKEFLQPEEAILQRCGVNQSENIYNYPYFTGVGGDQLLCGGIDYLSGLLTIDKIALLKQMIAGISGHIGKSKYRLWKDHVIIPHIKYQPFQDRMKGLAYGMVENNFNQKYDLTSCLHKRKIKKIFYDKQAQSDYEQLLVAEQWSVHGDSSTNMLSPYLDVRLVNFCLNLPGYIKNNGLVDKLILRQSMKNIVPEKILTRCNKGLNATDLSDGIRKEWPVLEKRFDTFYLEKLEIFKKGSMREMLWKFKEGPFLFDIVSAIKILTLEFWLESTLAS